jgi:putative lipoic acid-binding regulatory protein
MTKSDNGRTVEGPRAGPTDDERRLAQALEEAHEFPGLYPVVVIARREEGFLRQLEETISAEQGDAPYQIRERRSSNDNYRSYRVELYVEGAAQAIARKAALASLPGVLLTL